MNAGLRRASGFVASLLLLLATTAAADAAWTKDDCLACHEDIHLQTMDGRTVGIDTRVYNNSVHADLDCIDCHTQPANFDDLPHFDHYQKVDCGTCHEQHTQSFNESFHGRALRSGTRNAPDCATCHAGRGNPHGIQQLNIRSAENACRQCHTRETQRYDGSVHQAAYIAGKNSPGCVSCHPTHSRALPPSVGAINNLCETCHKGAMEQIWRGEHAVAADQLQGELSCASCHDVHATHKPHLDSGTLEACQKCHEGYQDQFRGSVHEPLIFSGKMNCLSCHRSHQVSDAAEREQFGCGQCHTDVEAQYRGSVHRLARLRGNTVAAMCGDCHGGHHVLPPDNPESPVAHKNIPRTCGKCHTEKTVVTSDYVRLPISLPNYLQSVHGLELKEGKPTAVCTDCHGTHDLLSTADENCPTNKPNLIRTCGQCHPKESEQFANSVHGRALAHGIADAPSCTDCHDEHLIRKTRDPRSPVSPRNQASQACAECHEDPEMAARYGLPENVIQSYLDSYHGWAIQRGGTAVAVCEDCHNTHDIRSRLDPESSIHPDNVVETCRRCHPNSNPKFASSYNHITARGHKMIHDWVRIAYIWLIALVLGGMALHNLLIYVFELRKHYRTKKKRRSIKRWNRSEVWQHMLLLITFIGLGITGFALRFPNTWWVDILTNIGLTETVRRVFHRSLAVMMMLTSIYHIFYLAFSRRGRKQFVALLPKVRDASDAVKNVKYFAGMENEHPEFATYDYTQKAEYWALIWGTAVMSISGLILWFPDVVTHMLPAWVVRVGEVVHFYEAILAVSAIVIWHFFYVILLPKEYPMSWIWITGLQPKEEWDNHHGLAKEVDGVEFEEVDGDSPEEPPVST